MLDAIIARMRGPGGPLGVTNIGLRTPSETLGQSTPAAALKFHQPAQQLQSRWPRASLRPPGR